MKKAAVMILVILALSMVAGVASAGVYKPDPILSSAGHFKGSNK